MGRQFKYASAQNGCRAIHLLLEKTSGCQVPLNGDVVEIPIRRVRPIRVLKTWWPHLPPHAGWIFYWEVQQDFKNLPLSIHPSIYLSISLQDPPNRGGRRHQGISPFYYIYHPPKLIFPIISCMRKCPVQAWDRIPQFSWYFYTFPGGPKNTRTERNLQNELTWNDTTRQDVQWNHTFRFRHPSWQLICNSSIFHQKGLEDAPKTTNWFAKTSRIRPVATVSRGAAAAPLERCWFVNMSVARNT